MTTPEPPIWAHTIVGPRDLDWLRRELGMAYMLANEGRKAEDRAHFADQAKRLVATILKIEEQARG